MITVNPHWRTDLCNLKVVLGICIQTDLAPQMASLNMDKVIKPKQPSESTFYFEILHCGVSKDNITP